MDKDGLIPIGRFAKLTDLSPKLLRRLDERGLLPPVYVDPDTRYRYYDSRQTRVAGLIHLCRQLGLPLDQTADLLADWETGDLRPQLERHRHELVTRLAKQTGLLRLLEQELERGDRLMSYEIKLKEAPAVLVMSAPGSVPRTHPHDPWSLEAGLRRVGERAMVHISREGEEPDAHPIILYTADFEHDDTIRFEVCFPVSRPMPDAPGVRCTELPAALLAFTVFRGAYDTVWNAFVELRAWVAEHGHIAAGPLREQGVVDYLDTDDSTQWVTELAVTLRS